MENDVNLNQPENENNESGESAAAQQEPKLTFGQFLLTSKKKAKKLGVKSKKTLFLLDIKEWVSSLLFAVVAVLLLINFVGRIITVDGTSMYPTLEDGERLLVTAYDVRFGSAPEKGDVVICHYPGRTSKWLGVFTVKTDFVKRVVGVPGDTVERKYGVTYVNGEAIDPSNSNARRLNAFYSYSYEVAEDGTITYYRTVHATNADGSIIDGERSEMELSDEQTYRYPFDYTYTLKDGEYFVVGDNRYNSHDSRAWNGPDLPYWVRNDASGHVGPITKSMIMGRVRSVVLPFDNARRVPNNAEYVDERDVEQ
ncbi:MAG: signal peptidase I [Clostridia bacterium]|nr:signal peptidase I [Clostridia bacterium]